MKIKGFLFDMDGVIVDTQHIHTRMFVEAIRSFGYETTEEEISHYAGTARGVVMHGFAKTHGFTVTDEEAEAVQCRKDELFRAAIEKERLVPIAGIPELLRELQRRKIPAVIASSSPQDFISFIVDRLQIRPYFHAFLSGADLPRSKPDPAIYRLAAEAAGAAPAECVVLEDATQGVAAAKAAGAYCIGFRNPHSGPQDLSQADWIVDRIEEIDLDKL